MILYKFRNNKNLFSMQESIIYKHYQPLRAGKKSILDWSAGGREQQCLIKESVHKQICITLQKPLFSESIQICLYFS